MNEGDSTVSLTLGYKLGYLITCGHNRTILEPRIDCMGVNIFTEADDGVAHVHAVRSISCESLDGL